MEELLSAMGNTSETSPGLDDITYLMLKKSHRNLIKGVLNLFNRIYAEESFPDVWRTAAIIPIPKPKKNASDPLNYRPISLTSCVCKLMEKMVNARLTWYLDRRQRNSFQKSIRFQEKQEHCRLSRSASK